MPRSDHGYAYAKLRSNGPKVKTIMPLPVFDETLDYVERALLAEQNAKAAKTLHAVALWRELAITYRELAEYDCGQRHAAERPGMPTPA